MSKNTKTTAMEEDIRFLLLQLATIDHAQNHGRIAELQQKYKFDPLDPKNRK